MQHLRSKEKRQERDARRYILDKSFHDPIMAETISRVSDSMLVKFLDGLYPDEPPAKIEVLRGEVLIDSRGRGSFQK